MKKDFAITKEFITGSKDSCSIQQYKDLRDCKSDLSESKQYIEVLERSIHFKNTQLEASVHLNLFVFGIGFIAGYILFKLLKN